MSNIASLPFMH